MNDEHRFGRRGLLVGALAAAPAAATPIQALAQSAITPGSAGAGGMDMSLPGRLQHAFDIRINFLDRRMEGPLPWGGQLGYTSVKDGIVAGPMLNGKVVERSGADIPEVRDDGVIMFNADYLLEASDGTMIYIHNQGYSGAPKDAQQPFAQPPGMRFHPVFKVKKGPHDWLTRTVIIGIGQRKTNPDHSIFRYWAWV
jgi:hypothetical protein